MKSETFFVLYDARGEEDGAVLVSASSEQEARKYRGQFGRDSRWFEYKVTNGQADEGRERIDIKA